MPRGLSEYGRDFLRNWSDYEGPVWKKVGLTLRNRAIATSWIRGGCCGHHGDPGC